MHRLSTFITRSYLLWFMVVIPCSFLISAQFYDWWSNQMPCQLCILQRGILLLIILGALLFLGTKKRWPILLFLGSGIVLSARHAYVLMYPEKVTQCLPVELIMELTGFQFITASTHWLTSIGRECSVAVDVITYFLVPVLLIYYLLAFYLFMGASGKSKN